MTSAPAPARVLPKLYRARPWLAALAAVLTELVVIGGVDNQGVSGRLREPLNDPGRVVADYSRGAIDAATTFWWRFAPANGQATHVWAAQFAAIGALVLLTWLGALAIARGSVTFGRVWIGIWALVTAVAPIAIMVRNVLVTPTAPGPAQSRIGQSVYGYDGFGAVIVAGLVLGLVAGLVTAAVAVSSRRQVAAATPVHDTGEQNEYYDDSFAPRYSSPPLYEPRPWGEAQWQPPAAQFPPAADYPSPVPDPAPQEDTTQLPRFAAGQTAPQEDTTQLPRFAAGEQPRVADPPASTPEAGPSGPQPSAEPSYGLPAHLTQPVPQPQSQPEPVPQPQSQPDPQPEPVPQPQSQPEPQSQPAAPPSRELADEELLADELAVDEHTQELPRVIDEGRPPRT